MDLQVTADRLASTFQLDRPVVALAFADAAPPGVEEFDGAVPSACSFWTKAEGGVFFASAEKHYNCPVGAMTMGFSMPEDVMSTLMQLVEHMSTQQYIDKNEPASIPHVTNQARGLVYGPLASLPVEPDLILMWLSPDQAMLYNEAAGSAKWAEETTQNLFGRPTCAALPAALEQARPTMSLGCIGMRTFTGIAPDRMLAAIPGAELDQFLAALATTARANTVMEEFYTGHKAQFV